MCLNNKSANILFLVSSLPKKVRMKHRERLQEKYMKNLDSYLAIEIFDFLVGKIPYEQISPEGEEYIQKTLNNQF